MIRGAFFYLMPQTQLVNWITEVQAVISQGKPQALDPRAIRKYQSIAEAREAVNAMLITRVFDPYFTFRLVSA